MGRAFRAHRTACPHPWTQALRSPYRSVGPRRRLIPGHPAGLTTPVKVSLTTGRRQGKLDNMNRTFALPKPPFRRTPGTRRPTVRPVIERPPVAAQRATAHPAPPVSVAPAAALPAAVVPAVVGPASSGPANTDWSVRWDSGWAAGSWGSF